MTYNVDFVQLREDFRNQGFLQLQVPFAGTIKVTGLEYPLYEPDAAYWYKVPENGTWDDREIGGVLDIVSIKGEVWGQPGSTAVLTLGPPGIYGRVLTQDYEWRFLPRDIGDEFEQVVKAITTRPVTQAEAHVPEQQWLDPGATVSSPRHGSSGQAAGIEYATEASAFSWWEGPEATVGLLVQAGPRPLQAVHVEIALARSDAATVTFQSQPFILQAGDSRHVNVTVSAPAAIYGATARLVDQVGGVVAQNQRSVEITPSLDGRPTEYVLVDGGAGWVLADDPGTSVDVRRSEGSLLVSSAGGDVLVYRPWLEHSLRSVTADRRWSEAVHEGGSYVRVDLHGRGKVNFSRLELSAGPLFTNGDPSQIILHDRPMWIALAPGHEAGPGRIALSFEDGDASGQRVSFDQGWLASKGIQNPVFGHSEEEVIPSRIGQGTFDVDIPHFSVIIVWESECSGCSPGSPPPCCHWSVDPGSCTFLVDDAYSTFGSRSLFMQGCGFGTHTWATRSIPGGIAAPVVAEAWVRVDAKAGVDTNWHRILWQNGAQNVIDLFVNTQSSSCLRFTAWGEPQFDDCFPLEEWILVQAFDIDWAGCTYSLKVAGTVLQTGLSLQPSGTCALSMDRLRLGTKGWGAEGWWLDGMTIQTAQHLNTATTAHAEKSFTDWAPNDWEMRITSAYDQFRFLYHDRIGINFVGPSLVDVGNVGTINDCTNARIQYSFWLFGNLNGADAYQLWVGRDLTGNTHPIPQWHYGCAASDTVYGGAAAASVVEGRDFGGDGYDANDPVQRGLISGHEFGHIYGRDGHSSACVSSCEIMAQTGGFVNVREFRFNEDSREEIRQRTYFGIECYDDPTANDPKRC